MNGNNKYIIWVSETRNAAARTKALAIKNKLVECGWTGYFFEFGRRDDFDYAFSQIDPVATDKILVWTDDQIQLSPVNGPYVDCVDGIYLLSDMDEDLMGFAGKGINLYFLGPRSGYAMQDQIQLIANEVPHCCICSMASGEEIVDDGFDILQYISECVIDCAQIVPGEDSRLPNQTVQHRHI